MLMQAGFTVQQARTGTEILDLITEDTDVVVLDINLPNVNGMEICQQLKAHASTAQTSVIFLSFAHEVAEITTIGSRLGVSACLAKPVSSKDLVNAINLAICQRDLQKRTRRQVSQSA